ncbi:copper homeostasis periplasmic binding protein CopC [Massilia sp. RP-1-19]|uniref:Copper homeostasis periplasmic binding protein CopC n=1 Tax=Massilia polaris TaxID=2728846 RepID=A0A848HFT7_9BURK|nr:copper homeostasis periplasmic binding protein CopC [Massilia polaris]NML59832.1 copper homeostasis periplasmic binding protein CopC [Massilia polaris]
MNKKYLLAAAAMMLAATMSSAAFAHAKLEASTPKANEIVAPAPKEVRLQFNEPLEMAFSKIKLVDGKGAAIQPLKVAVDKANAKVMVASLPALTRGAYRVQWTTLTRDGHKVKGEFSFQVK